MDYSISGLEISFFSPLANLCQLFTGESNLFSLRAVATWKWRVFDSSNKKPKRATKQKSSSVLTQYSGNVQLNCTTPKNRFAGFWVWISSSVFKGMYLDTLLKVIHQASK